MPSKEHIERAKQLYSYMSEEYPGGRGTEAGKLIQKDTDDKDPHIRAMAMNTMMYIEDEIEDYHKFEDLKGGIEMLQDGDIEPSPDAIASVNKKFSELSDRRKEQITEDVQNGTGIIQTNFEIGVDANTLLSEKKPQ